MKSVLISHIFGRGLVLCHFPDGTRVRMVQMLLKKGRLVAVEKVEEGKRFLIGFRRGKSRKREDFFPLAVGIPLGKQRPRLEDSRPAPRGTWQPQQGTGIMYKLKQNEALDIGDAHRAVPQFEKMEDGSFESTVTDPVSKITMVVNIPADSPEATKLEEIQAEAGTATSPIPEGEVTYTRAEGKEGPYTISEHIEQGGSAKTYLDAVAALGVEQGTTPDDVDLEIAEEEARAKAEGAQTGTEGDKTEGGAPAAGEEGAKTE